MQKEVIISNQGMSASDVLEIARHNAVVKLSDTALSAMAASRAHIDALVASSQPVYGVSTGFGALANRYVSVEQRAQLQRSLIRAAHHRSKRRWPAGDYFDAHQYARSSWRRSTFG